MAQFVKRLPKIWPAAASALLLVACFPPFRLGLLVFVALVPWLRYLRDCDGKRAFRSGMLFGYIFALGELSFIAGFVTKWTHSLALGLLPYLLGCLIVCMYFALFGWLANLAFRRQIPWAIPIAWAGVEVFRSFVAYLAFPYGLLAMPLTPVPALIQTAHYGSVFLVSAWVALANLIVAEILEGGGYARIRWYVGVFVCLLALSLARFSSPPEGAARRVVAGQPGVDMAFGEQRDLEQRIADRVDVITSQAHGADLLVLPEGIARSGALPPPQVLFKVDKDVPVVFGGQRGENPIHQSMFSFDGHWEYADKTRLVIFGEYVPFRNLHLFDAFQLPGGDLVPSDTVTTLTVGKLRVGGALCFEALFPDVTYRHALNGANILAVMSVDDWYFGTTAPEQLRDASNWRAIETGLPVVRAASLGYTAIIDARGQTIAEAPPGRLYALGASVTVPTKPDLFPLFPVFPYLALASILAIPVYDQIRKRRDRPA